MDIATTGSNKTEVGVFALRDLPAHLKLINYRDYARVYTTGKWERHHDSRRFFNTKCQKYDKAMQVCGLGSCVC
jgi:hypothetical protein